MVFGDGRLRSRFLQDWCRVEQFGGENISFLHDFVRRAEGWDETTLKECMVRWNRSIQFREPLPASPEAEELLDEMARLFLREPSHRIRPIRCGVGEPVRSGAGRSVLSGR
jgi:hypothetical protein